jgi:hypothetical protein
MHIITPPFTPNPALVPTLIPIPILDSRYFQFKQPFNLIFDANDYTVYREDLTVGYQFNYRKDSSSYPVNNGNAVLLQIAFSYDTLVESKESMDEYEDDGQRGSDNNSNININNDTGQNKTKIENEKNSSNIKKTDIQGYFGSVLEIFGLNEEINVVGEEFYKLKEINRKAESLNGKAGKRRAPSG